ncbi:hypothetical protein LDC_1193 [sediment metagenome]|uniref:Secretion system C-terminal sorting domain-containing protein n=1 Tax=sediment metagenome TaxID=749907 RepID=D9PI39_9ZZZZ
MKNLSQTLFYFLLLEQICFPQGIWTKIGDMPEIRYAHTVNELNGKIYVVGGANTESSVLPRTALVYDRSSKAWTQIPLYNNKIRQAHNSCIVGGKLYVMGGNDSIRTLFTMDMFDPNTGEWASKNSMSIDRGLASCVSIEGKIYVMGGMRFIGNTYYWDGLNQLEVYDTNNGTWTPLANMPTKRWGHSAVALNGKIYVFGGRSLGAPYSSIEVYDPQTNTWTTKSSNMPTARYCLTTCLFNDDIYAIGGWLHSSNGPIYNKVEVYNPESDSWNIETPMPVTRAVIVSIVLDGKIYVYGGSRTTHPLIGTSEIYELSYGNVFAQQSYVDKPYARINIDSVLFRTRFSNLYNLQFTPHLICVNSDNTQIDSTDLFDDGMHGDFLAIDGIYGAYIPPKPTEDIYSLSISTIENQTQKYYKVQDKCRFTTSGPVKFDSVSYRKGLSNYHYLRPFVRNWGSTKTIPNPSLRLSSNDPWIVSLGSGGAAMPNIAPDSSVGISTWITISVIDSLFPGYFNFKVEVMSDGWAYWLDSTQMVITNLATENQMSFSFKLNQNYPNPFNPTTKINWQSSVSCRQTLKIFDVLGNEVAALVDEYKSAGNYEVEFNASGLSSGIYFYQLIVGEFISTKKMILLR